MLWDGLIILRSQILVDLRFAFGRSIVHMLHGQVRSKLEQDSCSERGPKDKNSKEWALYTDPSLQPQALELLQPLQNRVNTTRLILPQKYLPSRTHHLHPSITETSPGSSTPGVKMSTASSWSKTKPPGLWQIQPASNGRALFILPTRQEDRQPIHRKSLVGIGGKASQQTSRSRRRSFPFNSTCNKCDFYSLSTLFLDQMIWAYLNQW